MDPFAGRLVDRLGGLPRTRGDGPVSSTSTGPVKSASPHTRGWTRNAAAGCDGLQGFPAHAGMDPRRGSGPSRRTWLPRTRGDGPGRYRRTRVARRASPHTRGWTRRAVPGPARTRGFPAHAGMDRIPDPQALLLPRLPRTRGDGPEKGETRQFSMRASPHTRGWTVYGAMVMEDDEGFPAHAGMDPGGSRSDRSASRLPRTRGDGPGARDSTGAFGLASPHTRGWTPVDQLPQVARAGFPAHAGMDLRQGAARVLRQRLPRTRGDGPSLAVRMPSRAAASPHTRGWTLVPGSPVARKVGFPAHAGMDPGATVAGDGSRRLPRTRGDGPLRSRRHQIRSAASPHTRGWTLAAGQPPVPPDGFPAHAGMDLGMTLPIWPGRRLPRTRGDGPHPGRTAAWTCEASPHTRGWTPGARGCELPDGGFPAHAGMDPTWTIGANVNGRLPRTRGDGPVLPGRTGSVPSAATRPYRGSPSFRNWSTMWNRRAR